MATIGNIFRRMIPLLRRREGGEEALSLQIDGCNATMTPDPDDAELAAQAILELMASKKPRVMSEESATAAHSKSPEEYANREEYYRDMAERIREAHRISMIRTTRYIAFCEQELKNKHLPLYGKDSVAQMECELFKRIDVVEYFGGEIKRRWQHCLAEVTVRLMAEGDNTRDVEQQST